MITAAEQSRQQQQRESSLSPIPSLVPDTNVEAASSRPAVLWWQAADGSHRRFKRESPPSFVSPEVLKRVRAGEAKAEADQRERRQLLKPSLTPVPLVHTISSSSSLLLSQPSSGSTGGVAGGAISTSMSFVRSSPSFSSSSKFGGVASSSSFHHHQSSRSPSLLQGAANTTGGMEHRRPPPTPLECDRDFASFFIKSPSSKVANGAPPPAEAVLPVTAAVAADTCRARVASVAPLDAGSLCAVTCLCRRPVGDVSLCPHNDLRLFVRRWMRLVQRDMDARYAEVLAIAEEADASLQLLMAQSKRLAHRAASTTLDEYAFAALGGAGQTSGAAALTQAGRRTIAQSTAASSTAVVGPAATGGAAGATPALASATSIRRRRKTLDGSPMDL